MHIIKKKKLNIRAGGGIFEIVLESWDGDYGYTVRVPKFPQIITQGDNIEEAKRMARDAIELCIGDKY